MKGERPKNVPQGLKPVLILQLFTERLKSCPDASCLPEGVFTQPPKPSPFVTSSARLKSCPFKATNIPAALLVAGSFFFYVQSISDQSPDPFLCFHLLFPVGCHLALPFGQSSLACLAGLICSTLVIHGISPPLIIGPGHFRFNPNSAAACRF